MKTIAILSDKVGAVKITLAIHLAVAAARATDFVLVPCRPTLFDLNAILETLDIAMLAKKPAKVILNAVPPRGSFTQQARHAIATLRNGVIHESQNRHVKEIYISL